MSLPRRNAATGVEIERDAFRHALGAHGDEARVELALLDREVGFEAELVRDVPSSIQRVHEGVRGLLRRIAAVEAEGKTHDARLDDVGVGEQLDRRSRIRTQRAPPVGEREVQVVEHLLAIALIEGFEGVFG
jgi:hypothetical protein